MDTHCRTFEIIELMSNIEFTETLRTSCPLLKQQLTTTPSFLSRQ